MILYFSATGNCKYVATRISEKTGDLIFAIDDCIKADHYAFELKENESIGIVSPTYDWGLPSIVREYLNKITFQTNGFHYTFFVATYGTTCGQTARMTNEFMEKKGLPIAARFSVKMPDTWTPIFDLSDKVKVKKTNEAAETEIDFVIDKITSCATGDFMKNKMPYLAVKMMYQNYENVRKTKNLRVEDTCIGCGLCAKKCPVQAIDIVNHKPEWIKEECVMCLRCLHRCPKFAIQYGNKTKNHGQYVNPNVKG